MSTYYENVSEDAKDFLTYCDDQVLEALQDEAQFWKFFQRADYNGAFHEQVTDRSYTPREAVEVLENCRNTETDSGLWDGLEPLEALGVMAAYSYANDVRERVEIMYDTLQEEYDDKLETLQEEWERAKAEVEGQISDIEDRIYALNDYPEEPDPAAVRDLEAQLALLKTKLEGLEELEDELPAQAAKEAWADWLSSN